MKIALYPGSFNPIHLGHISLARFVIDNAYADQVWILVSPHNPLKHNTELIDENHRAKMVQLALAGQTDCLVSTVEFDMPRPSYTIDTIRKLQNDYPEHEFLLMIGSDNAQVFDKWKDYDEILKLISVLVYPRREFPVSEALKQFPLLKEMKSPYYDISSTRLRQQLRDGADTGEWIHPDVLNYIRQNKLYLSESLISMD